MTVREILIAMARRWYVVLALLAMALLLGMLLLRDGGVYSTRTVVSFMFPTSTSLSASNGTTDESLIAFAGAVAQEINNGRPAATYSEDAAPFYGAGVREGVLVSLPYSGNQWATDFSVAEVEIQVVGRSREWVEETQADLVAKVLRLAEERQDELAVPTDQRIEISVVPLTLAIERIVAGRVGTLAAFAALVAAALLVAGWVAARWESASALPRSSAARVTRGRVPARARPLPAKEVRP
ncbi:MULTISPECIES: hypothetical protein [Microbacterium]|uniref:hypothetical protein n=1 Tax=Microbacterium TaxID=33882 RepID=UPI00146CD351|nr:MULTISPECIES: hypothetical protein [Microbacterium]